METKITTNVRMQGNGFPAYVNGRPRQMLLDAFSPSTAPVAVARINTDLRKRGADLGSGVPFAELYMRRAQKKLLVSGMAA